MFLLRCPFIWYPFLPKSKFSDFGQKPWTIVWRNAKKHGLYFIIRHFDQISFRTHTYLSYFPLRNDSSTCVVCILIRALYVSIVTEHHMIMHTLPIEQRPSVIQYVALCYTSNCNNILLAELVKTAFQNNAISRCHVISTNHALKLLGISYDLGFVGLHQLLVVLLSFLSSKLLLFLFILHVHVHRAQITIAIIIIHGVHTTMIQLFHMYIHVHTFNIKRRIL